MMTERQAKFNLVECAVEKKIDRLDERFLRFEMSQEEYDERMSRIRAWEEEQYRKIP